MPWLETEPVKERKKLIVEWLCGDFSVTELSERHGVSRKTAYQWIGRYEAERDPTGLSIGREDLGTALRRRDLRFSQMPVVCA